MPDGIGFGGHESGEFRWFLTPAMEQVLYDLSVKCAARPNGVGQRPLPRLRYGCGAAADSLADRIGTEAGHTVTAHLAAVRVLTLWRAEDFR
jgi:hypothetical protein